MLPNGDRELDEAPDEDAVNDAPAGPRSPIVDLGTDCSEHGSIAPDTKCFVRASAVACCSSGVVWYVQNGMAHYFGFHESEGNEKNSQLDKFRDWAKNQGLRQKMAAGVGVTLLRVSFGYNTDILKEIGTQWPNIELRGYLMPEAISKLGTIGQCNKNIDFFPFKKVKIRRVMIGGEHLVTYRIKVNDKPLSVFERDVFEPLQGKDRLSKMCKRS